MSRKPVALWLGLVSILVLLAAACGGDDPTPTPTATATPAPAAPTATPDAAAAFQAEWDALLVAAQAEGELQAFMCCSLGDDFPNVVAEFEDKYKIKVISSTGSSRNQVEKVKAERDAGKYTLDIWTGGARTSNTRLKPAGILDPIKPLLFHPEVLDNSAWYTGRLEYSDLETRNTVLAYVGNAATARIVYNTELLDPNDIQSFYDLLDPKYNGKIVSANDPRAAGTGTNTAFYYSNPELGPEFLRRLLAETDITIAADSVQAVNWIALGKFTICLFGCEGEARDAKKEGLPVQDSWPHVLKEGGRMQVGGDYLMAINKPPNPNAQKFFINWFMSREGQALMQKATESNSLRIDIPKDTVLARNLPKEGLQYTLIDTHPNYQEWLSAGMALAEEALGSVGK